MRDTNPAMQIVESTHVLAAVLVLGMVLIADLRLLGVADSRRAFSRVGTETLRLTWAAFALAVVTGSLMFTTSAHTYFGNAAFQLKALALLAAGLNMVVFQLLTARGIAAWDLGTPPRAARIAGVLSLPSRFRRASTPASRLLDQKSGTGPSLLVNDSVAPEMRRPYDPTGKPTRCEP
jgi:hypothetical protein